MAAAVGSFSLINTDKISAWLGAPVHHWKPNEVNQIKNIQRAFRNAYNDEHEAGEQVEVYSKQKNKGDVDIGEGTVVVKQIDAADKTGDAVEGGTKKDEESYLPQDSPLRSRAGDKKQPANPIFKDYDAFKASCSFDFWRKNFAGGATDNFLAETAEAVVSNICKAQSRADVRVHNGHVPLRKKREHITPLALMLHEFKMWLTHKMRTMNTIHQDTFREIRRRAIYIESVSQKEVWGDSAFLAGAGIRANTHDRMFRLFSAAKESLDRCRIYSIRQYNTRCSREKLQVAGELLKTFMLEEMKIVSARMTLDKKLEDPKTGTLHAGEFLNTIENHTFIDYKNFVNVLLFKLCQNPMVRASITSDYESDQVKEIAEDLRHWSERNMFCVPNPDGAEAEPEYKIEMKRETRFLPQIYAPAATQLQRAIREVDPKAPIPDVGKRVLAKMRNAFETDEDVGKVIKLVMKCCAAIQELVPTIYAIYQLWKLAGEGGDFTIYDTLRQHVIRVMQYTSKRVIAVANCNKALNKAINNLALRKEKEMEDEARKKRVRKYKPGWVMNQKYINIELMPHYKKTYKDTLARMHELAGDANNYDLTTDQLSDKVKHARKIFDAITGQVDVEDEKDEREEKIFKIATKKPTKTKRGAATEEDEVTDEWGKSGFQEKKSQAFDVQSEKGYQDDDKWDDVGFDEDSDY